MAHHGTEPALETLPSLYLGQCLRPQLWAWHLLLKITVCSHFLPGWQAHLFPSPRLLLMITAPKSSANRKHLCPFKTHPTWAPVEPGQHVCLCPRLVLVSSPSSGPNSYTPIHVHTSLE